MNQHNKDVLHLDTRKAGRVSEIASSERNSPAIDAQIVGRPRWLDTRLEAQSASNGDTAALTTAWEQHGKRCLDLIEGEFALVVRDNRSGHIFAAIDRTGRRQLYFRATEDALQLATDIDLLQPPFQSIESMGLSAQGLYDYVYFHMVPAPDSFFVGIGKLRAAHSLSWEGTDAKVEPYWLPNFSQTRSQPLTALATQLKQTLKTAVEHDLSASPNTGAFLSGGLDSSTVAGMLAELAGPDAPVFAIGFNAKGYDEMAYARITARHFGLKLHEYYVTPEDIVEALPMIAGQFGEPFGNSSALPAFFCARMAKAEGIDHLLAGDGGDELFAGNERYAKQQVFEHYDKVPRLLRRGLIEPIIKSLPEALPYANKTRSYIDQANIPLPDRMQTYNFLHQHAPAELFRADFLVEVDTQRPANLLDQVYSAPDKASVLDRMLYLDWQFTLADNDLRKVSQMCHYVGVDVSFPMLDDRLVDLSLQVPDALKLKGGRLRHFYKEALRGWLPQATIDKSKHGFGLPFGVWMQSHKPLKELALDNLIALKKRPWFNPEFIDRTIDLHRDGHASYYGELVWILMTLELWLSSKERRQATNPAKAGTQI